ncbi:MAG: hypothetical protein RL654_555 [Pseudomonadota bacterium]|jgi:hypothetical protein
MARTLLESTAFVLRPDPRWPRLLRMSLLLSPVLMAGWLVWHQGQTAAGMPPVWPGLAALSALVVQIVLVRRMLRDVPAGQVLCLRAPTPDDPDWYLDGQSGRPVCHVDAGNWLLLRFAPRAAGARWLALACRDQPDVWHGLRCALQARSRPAAALSSTSPFPPAER